MSATFDEHFAAFGAFQLVYSALDERLTSAVLKFAHAKGEKKRAHDARSMKFGEKVDYIKKIINNLLTFA